MKSSTALRLKTYLLILMMIFFGPLGDILLRTGMKKIGMAPTWLPADLFHFYFRAFTSGTIWLGVGSLLAFFTAYLLVLSWADYTYVRPAYSLAYGVVALLGYFVVGEVVSPTRWFGVLVICVGVFVVGHTHPRTTDDA
jgi:drug/metabolite transporter (DMT)-like permease